ncbi:MAG TPA: hypothetical protein VNU71_06475 [Burkholderiaceae bacterium]|nr:hypothetical protein [Burkholderiaceae bacterium]
MSTTALGRIALLLTSVALTACGGGGGDSGAPAPVPAPAGPTDAQRGAAATSTANSAVNACAPIAPFYWEIGDRNARLVSGSVSSASSSTVYTASSLMSIASASKWLYGAYVVQKRNAALSDSDIKFLNFRSGYTNFSICLPGQSVDGCVAYQSNGVYSAATDGFFAYDGGHMENHASQAMGLGPLLNAGLASEIRAQLGSDVNLLYTQPQLAGGVASTADDYARFLRKLLGGQLQMGALLGTHAVCTNPATCPTALRTPVPGTESWHYSLGHWVEDDPVVGDGAFSSAGAFGFYPWVDASKTWYGVLARQVANSGEGFNSADCGRLIRKAWVTGVVQ